MTHVLVIDDEPLIAALLEMWLKELNCDVVGPVGSVAGALRCIETEEVDAAIVDWSLHNEQCDAVAETLSARGIPFALSTGHPNPAMAERCKAAAFLAKPFDFATVAAAMKRLTGRVAPVARQPSGGAASGTSGSFNSRS
ncbi:MAG: response regulator [Alphaproteobacteria bacterium]|nr:response regulator [Alphaproteobacteria bacterium]